MKTGRKPVESYEYICINCNKLFMVKRYKFVQSLRDNFKIKYCSVLCRRQYSFIHKKSRKEIWTKYNKSKRGIFKSREWHQIKANGQDIFKNDSKCLVCFSNKDLVVHHKDGNNGRHGRLLNNKKENLLILCRRCHPKIHNRWGLKEVVSNV